MRALIPAVETYYADNSSYAGITTEKLRAYDNGIDPTRSWIAPTDAGVPAGVAIPDAGAESYCAVSLVGRWYSWKLGPGGAVRTSQQPQAACRP